MSSPSIRTMTSFSGADLVCSFANKVIGELQQISWAIQRQKAPVFTLGSPDPRSFSRGKRGIAGSLVFAVFDNDALMESLKGVWANISPPAMYTAAGNVGGNATSMSEDFTKMMNLSAWSAAADTAGLNTSTDANKGTFGYADPSAIAPTTKTVGSDGKTYKEVNIPQGFSLLEKSNILYADTLPPFDVTLTFANEYGQCAFQKIYDIDILNEGSGVSVDSMVMERQMTYIARRLSPMTRGVYSRNASGTIESKPTYVNV